MTRPFPDLSRRPAIPRIAWGLSLLLLGIVALPAAPVSFQRDLAPRFQRQCAACHDARKAKGRYRLDTFERLLQPGRSGNPPIVAGAPERSSLLTLLRAADPADRMPQDADPWTPAEIAQVEQWIREGATFDGPDPQALLATLGGPLEYPAPPEHYPRALPVSALAFAPSGSRLAVGGYHEVLLFDGLTGERRERWAGLPERIAGIAWTPDGTRLAVAGGTPGRSGEVVLIEAETGKRLHTLARGADLFLAVACSPDGSRLLAGGTDNAVWSFQLPEGQRQWSLAHHADWVTSLAWSADGARFVTGSRDRTARVCEGGSGNAIASHTEHGAPVLAVAFSPDGGQVWSGGRDRKLRLWDATNSESRRSLEGFAEEVARVVVTPTHVVAAGADGRLQRAPVKDPSRVTVLCEAGPAWVGLSVSTNQSLVAAGSVRGEVQVWKLDETQPFLRFPAKP
jgi:mono/diheme cytochrome c family protein